jgi:hypothetical protein
MPAGMVVLILVTIGKIFKWRQERQLQRYNNQPNHLALRSRDRNQLMAGKKVLKDIKYKKLR